MLRSKSSQLIFNRPATKETRKTPHSPLGRNSEKRLTLTKYRAYCFVFYMGRNLSCEGNKGRRSHRKIGYQEASTFGDSHLVMKTEPSRRMRIHH